MKEKLICIFLIVIFSVALYFNLQFDGKTPLLDLLGCVLLFGWVSSLIAFVHQFDFVKELLIKELDPDDESF